MQGEVFVLLHLSTLSIMHRQGGVAPGWQKPTSETHGRSPPAKRGTLAWGPRGRPCLRGPKGALGSQGPPPPPPPNRRALVVQVVDVQGVQKLCTLQQPPALCRRVHLAVPIRQAQELRSEHFFGIRLQQKQTL